MGIQVSGIIAICFSVSLIGIGVYVHSFYDSPEYKTGYNAGFSAYPDSAQFDEISKIYPSLSINRDTELVGYKNGWKAAEADTKANETIELKNNIKKNLTVSNKHKYPP
jgi:hypothetical protein